MPALPPLMLPDCRRRTRLQRITGTAITTTAMGTITTITTRTAPSFT